MSLNTQTAFQAGLLQKYSEQLLTAHSGAVTITRLVTRSLESQERILSDDETVSLMDALESIADQVAEIAARIEEISEARNPEVNHG
ncbi:hypothetical protein [Oceanospirillum sanctuarii]|uniref:hypothetical protein n=1 Tax=Oceanospirillum sanctuarii TaxID=1434821 RepID=UPI000A3B0039|nr:hypothetical protein [Oceanospirillum sanctuarii]